ncbi:bolA-like protein 2 [Ruditapes philippinarum]|uniref:bolA-like protein 2 n=1 Tax=Ruditapes philippinarum TaxID=129788 RepID=UPI00295AC9E0|nr:bolA-like protein 2 [Ruditapes philippinarum]
MVITTDVLEEKIKSCIEVTHVKITDTSDGCGAKFQALVVSPKFEGMPLLQRHRLINSAVEEEMKQIHAFQIKSLTPQQYENLTSEKTS